MSCNVEHHTLGNIGAAILQERYKFCYHKKHVVTGHKAGKEICFHFADIFACFPKLKSL
jgi:hypothetical protein